MLRVLHSVTFPPLLLLLGMAHLSIHSFNLETLPSPPLPINHYILSIYLLGVRACICMISHIWLFATLWTVAHQPPLPTEFSRQEYWSGLPFPTPGDLPNPRIKPKSPALVDFLPLGKPHCISLLFLTMSFYISPSPMVITLLQPIIISYLDDWNAFVVDLASNLASLQSFYYFCCSTMKMGFPDSSVGKESTCNAGDAGLIPEFGRSAKGGIGHALQYSWASLVAQLVKNLPAMWELWVWSLDWEEPLKKRRATHSSILAWRIPTVHGIAESDTTEQLSLSQWK